MSGIAGIIRFDGAPVEPGFVERMTAAMAHRGPDGIHHWVRGPVTRQALKGMLPAQVLIRAGKAEFTLTFRRQLQSLGAEMLHEIVARRAAWIRPQRAIEICTDYQTLASDAWAQWGLWSVVGCDALFIDRELL
jgi:hypothetical protein